MRDDGFKRFTLVAAHDPGYHPDLRRDRRDSAVRDSAREKRSARDASLQNTCKRNKTDDVFRREADAFPLRLLLFFFFFGAFNCTVPSALQESTAVARRDIVI